MSKITPIERIENILSYDDDHLFHCHVGMVRGLYELIQRLEKRVAELEQAEERRRDYEAEQNELR